jgi:hypothetical protein
LEKTGWLLYTGSGTYRYDSDIAQMQGSRFTLKGNGILMPVLKLARAAPRERLGGLGGAPLG